MNQRKGEWALLSILLGGLFLCVFVLMVAAWKAGYATRSEHVDVIIEPLPLPRKCAEFFNDGTEDWINCMGVGYQRHMVRTDF